MSGYGMPPCSPRTETDYSTRNGTGFFRRVVERASSYMSDEHFSLDGTLIEAWASQKSFQPKQGGPEGDGGNFHGQQRRNDTHASTSDPDSRLYRKSQGSEARLAYLGHVLMENRYGLIADAMVTHADGDAEREAAADAARAMEEAATTAPHGGRR